MPPTTSRLAASLVAVLATAGVVTGAAAQQQGQQIEYMWGGGSEWGGGKQTVSFAPSYKKGQIVVSFADRRLYHVIDTGKAVSYPIAVPREKSRWEGVTTVSQKRENPPWTPTPSMIAENPRLPRWVPGGHPMNPLGVRALYLGTSAYRIHGTDAPWTIGQPVSKGCIRMFNEDVIDLYQRIPVGTRVTVTWQRFQTGPAVAAAETATKKAAAPAQSSASSGSSGFNLFFGPSEEEEREARLAAARANADARRAQAEKKRQVIKRYTSRATRERQAAVE